MKKITILLFITTAVLFGEEQIVNLKSTPVDSTGEKIFLDKISVTGTLEKPQAVFVLPGQTPEVDDIQINRSFMQELFRPVEKLETVPQKPVTQTKSKK